MDDLQLYRENTEKPWGKLFYRAVLEQLAFAKGLRVLDFGSGFGHTANALAAQNDVVAVEPDERMCEMRVRENGYRQIVGGLEALRQFQDQSFDLVICHNVLEYVEDQGQYFAALARVLRRGGRLSLVKHNHPGRVMQRILFENNYEMALSELEGQSVKAMYFGQIKYYTDDEIAEWAENCGLRIGEKYGVRMFFALIQDNEVKHDPAWQQTMAELERGASGIEAFRNIAFFHHVIFKK